jgi:multidrug efflux pump
MSMGIAVIGGLVVGGALTLFVIPAMFLLFSRKRLPQAGEAVETIEAEIAQAAAARA